MTLPQGWAEIALEELCGTDASIVYGIIQPGPDVPGGVHRFRAYRVGVSSEYAQLVFLHHLRQGIFMRAASLTTNIAHLTSERLKPLPFPLAPIEEQAALVKRVRHGLDATTRLRACLEEASAKLSAEERGILTKAFQGALVPQDPAAEPAAAMLARLRAAPPAAPTKPPRRRSTKTPA